MLDTRTRDFIVGLLVLVTVGVLAAVLVRMGRRVGDRYDLYMRADVAQGLVADTRVYLQGLEVGRLRQVNPLVDTTTSRLTFVARLEINDRFPDGSLLRLPHGTEAELTQPTPIADPVIVLQIPQGELQGLKLEPGDTIPSRRRPVMLDALADAATTLSAELLDRLRDAEELLALSATTLTGVNATVHRVDAALVDLIPRVDSSMTLLASALESTERMLAEMRPRAAPLADSVMLAVTEARTLIARFDTLATGARQILDGNTEAVAEIVDRMRRTTATLEHFADQVSRRPMRLLTGVNPPEPDGNDR